MFITAYKDPGIIPRQPPVEGITDFFPLLLFQKTISVTTQKKEDPFRHFKRSISVKINGYNYTRKYCGNI